VGTIGDEITVASILPILKQASTQIAAKEILKFIPFFGQVVAAGISYTMLQSIGKVHLNDCYAVAAATILNLTFQDHEGGVGSPSQADPYAVLEISRGAAWDEVKRAYHKRCREYHPDLTGDLGLEIRQLAERKMKQINAAYEALEQEYAEAA
jgi:DnaJ-domain-containing protein 1